MGVIVAGLIIGLGPGSMSIFSNPSAFPGVLALLFIMFLIIYMVIRDHMANMGMRDAFGIMFRRRR